MILPRLVRAENFQNKKVSSTITAPSSPIIPSSQQQEPAATVNSMVNPITQAAVQKGVLICADSINKVSNFLVGNNPSGAYLTFAPVDQNQHIFSASSELIDSKNASVYVSSSFTPTPAGGCDAVYDVMQFVPDSCMYFINNIFRLKGNVPVLKKNIMMLNAGADRIYLMPAGNNGCVLIRKQVLQ